MNKSNIRKLLAVSLVSSILLIGTWQLLKDDSSIKALPPTPPLIKQTTQTQSNTLEPNSTPNRSALVSQPLQYESTLGPLPPSLDGTLMNMELHVDEAGNLRITSSIKTIFDYFLSTIGEESGEKIISRIQEYIDYYLDDNAKQQALAILDHYIEMKMALFNLEESLADTAPAVESINHFDKLKEQLQSREGVRQSHLSPEVYEAFYAEEAEYDELTLQRLEISSNTSITEDEKLALLADHEANLPEEIRKQREKTVIHLSLKESTSQLVQSGASNDDIYQYRAETVGVEAANRLTELDQTRSVWNERVKDYRRQRDQVLSVDGLSDAEKNTQVTQIRGNLFDPKEQIRIGVLDRREGLDDF
jgi:lipase chaperone LimK